MLVTSVGLGWRLESFLARYDLKVDPSLLDSWPSCGSSCSIFDFLSFYLLGLNFLGLVCHSELLVSPNLGCIVLGLQDRVVYGAWCLPIDDTVIDKCMLHGFAILLRFTFFLI